MSEAIGLRDLLHRLASLDDSVGDEAALRLGSMRDCQAVRPLLWSIAQRQATGRPFSALVYALTQINVPEIAGDLARILIDAPYRPALNAGIGLRDLWPQLSATQREDVVALLREVEVLRLEEWRADWIGDIVREGGWMPETGMSTTPTES